MKLFTQEIVLVGFILVQLRVQSGFDPNTVLAEMGFKAASKSPIVL